MDTKKTSSGTSWYKFDLTNEAHMVRCIKQLEFMVRKSMSYDSWQKRTKYAVTMCPTCGESFEFVKPESHHHPVTLFDVVEGVLNKHIDLCDLHDFTDFQICDEIMQAHFAKKVQYVVLCKQCHEKYHSSTPSILDIIDEAQLSQKKIIDTFYSKDINGTADK